MSVTLQNSNIIINDGTTNFIMERLRAGGKRKNTIETNAPTTSPEVDIYPVSRSSDDKYLMFKYDLNMNYNKIPADDTNLIAWYKFDKGSNDSSGNNKHLTHYNPVSTGYYDDAAFFGGSTYFEAANNGYFSPEVFSISIWCNLTGTGNAKAVASCRGTSPSSGWIIYKYDQSLQFWYFGGSSFTINNVFNNGWVHLLITTKRTSNNACNTNIYINGILTYSASNTYIRNTGTNLRIGAGKNETSSTYYLENKSLLRDFRMYNIELSATDVAMLFNKNYGYTILNADATNLVAWYKFDDDVNDSSGNNNNLTALSGTVQLVNTQYKIGKSAYFTSDTLKLNTFTFHNKPFAVAFWSYYTEPGSIITQPFSFSTNNNLHINIQTNYSYRFGFYANDLDTSVYDDRNQWVHLIFQIDEAKNREIWRNGVRIANDTSYTFLNTQSADVWIGNWETINNYYGGYLDDFRIYDKALSASEVSTLYTDINKPTTYTLNVPEDTSCDVLVINNTQAHKATGLTLNGTYNVIVGSDSRIEKDGVILHNPNSGLSITDSITGASIQYTANNPIVIIRYSMSATTTAIVNTQGYLTYDSTDGWYVKNDYYLTTNGGSKWSLIGDTEDLYYSSNVKIGGNEEVTPVAKLEVNGDIVATGRITAGYSDDRLKDYISNITNPIDIIKSLNGYYYKPNELANSFGYTNQEKEIGVSAQEVKSVLPEIVKLAPFDSMRNIDNELVSKSGSNYLTVNYEKMAPLFIEAIKKLSDKIDRMTIELNSLKQI
jgi:hypothetical protein